MPILGVVENMCSFTCNDCGAMHYPFGRSRSSLQERFGLPTLAELPIMPGVSDLSSKHAGADIPGFTQMSDQVHRAIGKSRVEAPDRPQVSIVGSGIQVRWSDGHEATLAAHDVRCACPCAVCVDENTGAKLLDPDQVPLEVTVEAVQQLGNYAVSFAWSDGHTTGIYSWDFLRALADREAGAAF